MTRAFNLGAFFLLSSLVPLPAFAADELPAAEKAKIEALIQHVEGLQGAKFIRNDKEYDAASAAKFLRGKWAAHSAQVKSAADFIDKLASVSSTTGKPYLIRFKDGKEVKSGEHLRAELERLNKT